MTRILSLLLALLPSIAAAHDFYDYSCCSTRDCRPIEAHTVRETPAGYVIQQNSETIAYGDKRIRPSPDGRYHLCTAGGFDTGRAICVYVPTNSF